METKENLTQSKDSKLHADNLKRLLRVKYLTRLMIFRWELVQFIGGQAGGNVVDAHICPKIITVLSLFTKTKIFRG